MNSMKWFGALVALGASVIASSQASAVSCLSPGNTLSDIIPVGAANPMLDCRSTSNTGVVHRATAEAHTSQQQQAIVVSLLQGVAGRSSATARGYDTNRQAIASCVIQDSTPNTGGPPSKNCGKTVAFVDLTTADI